MTKFLILFFVHASFLFSQANLDSLLNSFSNQSDTVKIRQLNEFTWKQRSNNPHMALRSGLEAIKISTNSNNTKFLAKSLNLTGVVYRNLIKYDKAITTFKEALRVAELNNDSSQIAYSLNNIGGIYRIQGSYAFALDYILKALRIFEKLKDKTGSAFCTINIGLIYRKQNNYPKALEYLKQTLALRKETGDKAGKALVLNLIAEVYCETGDLDSALRSYFEVENEYKLVNDKKGLANVWGGIARILYEKNEINKALEYRKLALELASKIQFTQGIIANYCNLGLIYAKKGNFLEADKNFSKALQLTNETEDIFIKIESFDYLIKYNEMKKDFEQALFYSRKSQALKDSLRKRENIQRASEVESVYQWEKKERENFQLRKDLELKDTQKNFLTALVVLFLIFIIFTYSRYRSKKKDSEQLAKINSMKDTLLRIIAHDLKTPFTVIFGYTEVLREDFNNIEDEEKLTYLESIRKASRLSIELLENLTLWSKSYADKLDFQPVKLILSDLIRENIYILESTAENKYITITSTVTDDVEAYADENMVKTILRNLISNGIKFTNENGYVKIYSSSSKNEVTIVVEDSGIGMDEVSKNLLFNLDELVSSEGTAGERGTGFGLVLCKEFVSKNGGKIWVESELNKGSKFIFTLPRSA